MKKLLFGGSAALALALPLAAQAADLPPAPAAPAYKAPVVAPEIFSWTGFYIGVNAGGHYDSNVMTATADSVGFLAAGVNPTAFDTALGTTLHPQGFIGGGQAGFNWQAGNFLFGVEADANGLTGSTTRTFVFGPGNAAGLTPGDFVTDSTGSRFLATARARLGVTFDRVLLYATGGAAWGSVQATDTFGAVGGTVVSTISSTTNRFGWTVGGGVEWAIGYNWSFKAEYLYVNLGNFSQSTPAITGFPSTDVAFNHAYSENIARIGVNYRFGGPVVARY
jgi:outer membrane immunogenic protein